MSNRPVGSWLALAMVVAGAASLAIALTARFGATADSIQYLFAGRSLAAGEGFRTVEGEPFLQYAPLFPVLLAAGTWIGADVVHVARMLLIVCFTGSTLLAGLWTRRITGTMSSAALGGVAAMLIAPALLVRFVWSEPLFIFVALAAGLCLTTGLQRSSLWWLVAAGSFTGLAAITRWAGLPLLGIAVYVGCVWGGRWRARGVAAAAFGAPAAVVAGAVLVRNAIESSRVLPATPDPGRSLGQVATELISGVAGWFAPPAAPWALGALAATLGALSLAWAVVALRGRRSLRWWAAACAPFVFGSLYVAANVAGALRTSIGSLDERMLTPSYPFFVIGAVGVVWTALVERLVPLASARAVRSARLSALLLPPLLMWTVALGALGRYGVDLQLRERLAPSVVGSETLATAAGRPRSVLYSNAWVNAAWVAERPVRPIMLSASELRRLDEIARRNEVLLIWAAEGDLEDGPSLEQVRSRCDIVPLSSQEDGQLLRVLGCTPPR